jgi:hypothetical protein
MLKELLFKFTKKLSPGRHYERGCPTLSTLQNTTKITIMAAQDQAISRNYFKKKIVNKKLKVGAPCANNMKRLLTT